jgi:cobalt/nickel transport system permease protein
LASLVRVGLDAFRDLLANEGCQNTSGFMQKLDSRVKLIGLAALITLTIFTHNLAVESSVLLTCYTLTYISKIPLRRLFFRSLAVTLPASTIALPRAILSLDPSSTNPLSFQPLPGGLGYLLHFMLRVAAASTTLALLISSTSFSQILASLRWFRVPSVLLWAMAMTHRYLILLASELYRLTLARESRVHKDLSIRRVWEDGGKMLGVFLVKSVERGERVQMAALSRNGGADMKLYYPTFEVGAGEMLFTLLVAALLFFGLVISI